MSPFPQPHAGARCGAVSPHGVCTVGTPTPSNRERAGAEPRARRGTPLATAMRMPVLRAATVLFTACLIIRVALPASVRADEPVRPGIDYKDAPGLPVASEIPRECKPRYMAGPAVGIPLGLGTAGLGSAFVFIATTPSSSRLRDSSTAIGIAGSVMIPTGTAVFIYSAVKAKRNRQERRRVCNRPAGALRRLP